MRLHIHPLGRALALAALGAATLGVQAQSSYSYLPLKPSSALGSSRPQPRFINSKGVVAGTSDIAVNARWTFSSLFGLQVTADRWTTVGTTWSRTGTLTLLDDGKAPATGLYAVGGINASGLVVGRTQAGQAMTVLGKTKTLLPNADNNGMALGVNDQGLVVGLTAGHAHLWRAGQAIDLHPASSPLPYSEAVAINNANKVAITLKGSARDEFDRLVLLPQACATWTDSVLRPLSSASHRWCRLQGLSDRDVAIGQIGPGEATASAVDETTLVGVTWQGQGEPQALPLPAGWVVASGTRVRLVPRGINSLGVVVGDIVTATPSPSVPGAFYETQEAFVHRNGQTYALSKLLKGLSKTAKAWGAWAINDEGRIVVEMGGLPSSTSSRGVLTPNP